MFSTILLFFTLANMSLLGTRSFIGVATPLLEECEDDTHTPKMGTWESSGTPETLEFDCKGQNTSP
jgi:hypothetical protein